MHIDYRKTCFEDFTACSRILRERYQYEENVFLQLPDIWRRMYAAGCMISALVEDFERPQEVRIIGFGASVFVTDDFMSEVQKNPIPYLCVRVIDRILGNNSPLLSQAEIRRDNSSDGLNLLVLHHSVTDEIFDKEEISLIRIQLIKAFLDYHGGYNVKEIIAESLGEKEIKWVLAPGTSFQLRSTYASFYRNHKLPEPEQRPFLIGVNRLEAGASEAAVLSPLLIHTKPRFFFPSGEQELLNRALIGEIDEELAINLNVSISTVKKRWTKIYDRVAALDEEILPIVFDDNGQKRGTQKRHLLLRYLRHHPEELRPVEPRFARNSQV